MRKLSWNHRTSGGGPASATRSGPETRWFYRKRRPVVAVLCRTIVVLLAIALSVNNKPLAAGSIQMLASNSFLVEQRLPTATIHADACAPEGGDGSAGNPYNTLTLAATTAVSGDTIVLGPGVYKEALSIGDKALTLTAAGGNVLVGKLRDFDVATLEVEVPLQVVAGDVCCHCVTPDLCGITQLPLLCPSEPGGCAPGGSPYINARVYYPTFGGTAVCGSPAVVYAHGFRSEQWVLCDEGDGWGNPGPVCEDYLQTETILRQLAASGTIVISFDASCGLFGTGRGSFALNALAYLLSEFEGVVDPSRVGFAGHSLGGGGAVYAATHVHDPAFSVLNLNDVVVRAVALIAPDFLDTESYLSELDAASLTIYGTTDPGLTAVSYNMAGPPKHLVVIDGANHFGYTDDICIADPLQDPPSTVGGVTGPEAHARQRLAARNYVDAFFSYHLELPGRAGAIDYLTQQTGQSCTGNVDPSTCGPPRRLFDDLENLSVEVGVCSCP